MRKLFTDVFKPEEIKLQEAREKDVEQRFSIVGDKARVCLGSEPFKHYREQYEELEAKVIDELILDAGAFPGSNDSTEKFGAKCLVKLTRLRDLRSLMRKVTTDAQKQPPKANEN